jgi:hypothetical protein
MFFPVQEGFSFGAVHTLVFPLISTGNVGQLAADFVVNSIVRCKDMQKVGYLWHDAVEHIAGLGAIDGDAYPVLNLEVFYSEKHGIVVVQQRGLFSYAQGEDEFIRDLIHWAVEELKIQIAILLFSLPDHQKIDRHLLTPKILKFVPLENVESDMKKRIESMEMDEMEMFEEDLIGVNQILMTYKISKDSKVPEFYAFGTYAAEGDNALDGIFLGNAALDVLGFQSKSIQRIPPESWNFAFGSNVDSSLRIFLE